jgi:hypothetical protein
VLSIYEGTSEIQRMIIARDLLGREKRDSEPPRHDSPESAVRGAH